jgi:hypothetical protein
VATLLIGQPQGLPLCYKTGNLLLFRKKNKNNNPLKDKSMLRSIMEAYLILILHVFVVVLLVGGIGFAIIFIGSIAKYIEWVLLGGFILIAVGGYTLFRLLKKERKSIREVIESPMLVNRDIKVSFLGGFASINISGGEKDNKPQLEYDNIDEPKQINDYSSINSIEYDNNPPKKKNRFFKWKK